MKNLKGFIAGVLTTLIFMAMAGTVFAAQISKTITAVYRDIKITVDGKQIEPKDATGNIVEPFISDGTTYLPVRSVADAVGYDVAWDGDTNTINLTKKAEVISTTTQPQINQYLSEFCKVTYSKEQLHELGKKIYWSTLIEFENIGNEPIEIRMNGYDLTDKDGKLLAVGKLLLVSEFPSILYPGEKGIFVDSTEIAGIDINTKVNFVPRWDIKTTKTERINLDISDVDIREGRSGTSIFGRITNNTGKEQTIGRIEVLLYAADGIPIGIAFDRITEDMPDGESFGFEISVRNERFTLYEDITPDMIVYYKVYAYTGL